MASQLRWTSKSVDLLRTGVNQLATSFPLAHITVQEQSAVIVEARNLLGREEEDLERGGHQRALRQCWVGLCHCVCRMRNGYRMASCSSSEESTKSRDRATWWLVAVRRIELATASSLSRTDNNRLRLAGPREASPGASTFKENFFVFASPSGLALPCRGPFPATLSHRPGCGVSGLESIFVCTNKYIHTLLYDVGFRRDVLMPDNESYLAGTYYRCL